MGRARLALAYGSLTAALLGLAGCGGSGAKAGPAACSRRAELAAEHPADLAGAIKGLAIAIRADRELSLQLPADKADAARAAYAEAARTLGSLQQVDPRTMTALRDGVASAQRELQRAQDVLKQACG